MSFNFEADFFANFYKATITPANSEDTTAFVIDDPFQQYVVAADAATGVTTFLKRMT